METFASTDTKAQALARLNANFTETTNELAGKASTSHTHAISGITGLQAALDAKVGSNHTHAVSEVTGLQAALDGKQAAGNYATQASLNTLSATVGDIEAALIAING